MTNLPYNEKDISSIFNYSKQLVNKCLRDFAPDAEEHKGKGSLGQLVEELFFKYDLNSRQEADFAFVNAELKCTPLKESAKKELLIKERLVCSMINYTADWNKNIRGVSFLSEMSDNAHHVLSAQFKGFKARLAIPFRCIVENTRERPVDYP